MATSNFTYSYVGVYSREIDEHNLERAVKITPSLHTNVPPKSLNHLNLETLKRFTETDGWDEEQFCVRNYSFGRVIWYLERGFPEAFAFNEEVTVDGLTMHILDRPVYDHARAIIWFPTQTVTLASHKLPVRKGVIGVPYTRGWLPIHILARVWLTRIIPFPHYLSCLLPSYCSAPPVDLSAHGFPQGNMHQVSWRRYTERNFPPGQPFGNLPSDGRAPWIIITDAPLHSIPVKTLDRSDKKILRSYFA